jgi:hypothetical protein
MDCTYSVIGGETVHLAEDLVGEIHAHGKILGLAQLPNFVSYPLEIIVGLSPISKLISFIFLGFLSPCWSKFTDPGLFQTVSTMQSF